MGCREQGSCRVKPVFYLLNMDVQDAQDNQNGTLPHQRLTPAMIAYGFADVQEYKLECKPAVSRKTLCILCIKVNKPFTHA